MTRRQQLACERLADLDPLVGVRDIRAWLGVSDAWVRHQLAAGRFPRAEYRLGSALRWKKSTVTQWLERKGTETRG